MKTLIFTLAIFFTTAAHAYPDFISYGYNTCISCHYNSHGYGPLTDYGKALFSQEIAARNFWTPKSVSDEEVAEKSARFVPGVDLPFWIRPNIKFRGIWFEVNPGTQNPTKQWIRMQRDFNLVLSADQDYKTILVINYGLTPEENYDFWRNGEKVNAISREHYVRFFPTKKLLLAAGFMDIAYGLRTGDHTSYSRDGGPVPMGLGHDGQVHGVLGQWFEEKWDATLHAYIGNLFKLSAERKKGASMTAEYLTSETNKVGFSLMHDSSDVLKEDKLAVHDRFGIPKLKGTSIIAEVGVRRDDDLVAGTGAISGMYGMAQTIIRLTRGYNIQSTIERYQNELKSTSAESDRWTIGFLLFPLQQTELRLDMVQEKSFSPNSVTPDSTMVQGQIHVSW